MRQSMMLCDGKSACIDDELINESKNVVYDNNTKANLTKIFFINN